MNKSNIKIKYSNLLKESQTQKCTIKILQDNNKTLENRVKELEDTCINFIDVETNLHNKIKQLKLEIINLRKDLNLYVEKFGLGDTRTLAKSQEMDRQLNKLSRMTAS
jgi:uncharacterized coiled-coil protein SlyX